MSALRITQIRLPLGSLITNSSRQDRKNLTKMKTVIVCDLKMKD